MEMKWSMGNELINVLIVDDEKIVREGLRMLIDWEQYGFCICGESETGTDALDKISLYNPGLVLLDIRMPEMDGTQLIEHARNAGFKGYFIIISGYSDFKYAQTALHFGVSYYLTKPIDDDELVAAINNIRKQIEYADSRQISNEQYRSKARTAILRELLVGREYNNQINYIELGLSAPIYQVVIYEGYMPYYQSYNFVDLLKVSNRDNSDFEQVNIDNRNCILLKGNFAIERFNTCLFHYAQGTQKGSPLDTVFLTYGPAVSTLSKVNSSYEACLRLMERRFFCNENQHVLSYNELPDTGLMKAVINGKKSQEYGDRLIQCITSCRQKETVETLDELRQILFSGSDEAGTVRHFLAGIFLQVKQYIMHMYPSLDIPFLNNGAVLELIDGKYYLYEILQYFMEQFEMMIRAIGSASGEDVFNDVLNYISVNYRNQLKLEDIAPLFGYSSSYFGKLFTQKMGLSFNSYLDKVRITEAARLLNETDMKVYEIAEMTGYSNTDYFYQKFRKVMDITPAEYRAKRNLG